MNTNTYRLNRIVSIYSISTADHLTGPYFYKELPAMHQHMDAWELCYCTSGQITILQDNRSLELYSGQCLLIPPGVEHLVTSSTNEALVLSFTCTDSHLSMLRALPVDTSPRQRQCFAEIITELRSAFDLEQNTLRIHTFRPNKLSPLGAEQLICCYLEEILIEILRSIVQQDGHGLHDDLETAVHSFLADQVTAYIRENLSESISVEQIAAHFHYSRNRMGILYKASTGKSLGKAITELRISKAKELIQLGEKSITEISYELGFSTPQYFSRKFCQETGMCPSRYVQICKTGNAHDEESSK